MSPTQPKVAIVYNPTAQRMAEHYHAMLKQSSVGSAQPELVPFSVHQLSSLKNVLRGKDMVLVISVPSTGGYEERIASFMDTYVSSGHRPKLAFLSYDPARTGHVLEHWRDRLGKTAAGEVSVIDVSRPPNQAEFDEALRELLPVAKRENNGTVPSACVRVKTVTFTPTDALLEAANKA